MLEATAGANITFPIALDGTDGVPVRSIIAIRGLPQGSKLSSGRPYDETEWNLKPDEIGDLHLALTGNESSEANVIIQLVAPDGAIIADAATVSSGSNRSQDQSRTREAASQGCAGRRTWGNWWRGQSRERRRPQRCRAFGPITI